MKDISILLVCPIGISTSILMKRMNEAAEETDYNITLNASAPSDVDQEMKKAAKRPDIFLLGPHVKYMIKEFDRKYSNSSAIDIINMQDYGEMNGKNVFEQAVETVLNSRKAK
jgi:PTS system cellobiose-specific IIB component